MKKGPEDTPAWSHPSQKHSQPPPGLCRICKAVLHGKHCAEWGCPWCAQCGAKAGTPKKKK